MELAIFLEKSLRLQCLIQAITLKIRSCRTMCKYNLLKKEVKIQDSMDKKYLFVGTLPFQPLGKNVSYAFFIVIEQPLYMNFSILPCAK